MIMEIILWLYLQRTTWQSIFEESFVRMKTYGRNYKHIQRSQFISLFLINKVMCGFAFSKLFPEIARPLQIVHAFLKFFQNVYKNYWHSLKLTVLQLIFAMILFLLHCVQRTHTFSFNLQYNMQADQYRSCDNVSAKSSDSDVSDVSAISRTSSASRLSSTSFMSEQSERPRGRIRWVGNPVFKQSVLLKWNLTVAAVDIFL